MKKTNNTQQLKKFLSLALTSMMMFTCVACSFNFGGTGSASSSSSSKKPGGGGTIVVPGTSTDSSSGNGNTEAYVPDPFGPEVTIVDAGEDTRPVNLETNIEYTARNLIATDAYGREVLPHGEAVTDAQGNKVKRDVGIFYMLLNGQHPSIEQGIYDVTQLKKTNPDMIFEMSAVANGISPMGQQHWWGEPLFGYYRSNDPWIINRHIQMLIDMGVDFIGFDTTNILAYVNVTDIIVDTLNHYKAQGFKVPQLMWITNTDSHEKVVELYNSYFNEATAKARGYYYPDLWYSPNGKPLIAVNKNCFVSMTKEVEEAYNAIDPIQTQWPNEKNVADSWSWMEFIYPQMNHNGMMNVSVMQHAKTCAASDQDRNWGRGYSHPEGITEYGLAQGTASQRNKANQGQNSLEAGRAGLNLSRQWDTVYNNINDVDTVFITQFNEWTMPKLESNGVAKYIDLYDEEYSRDIEPMKGGYGDNLILLTRAKINRYKYDTVKRYTLPQTTISGANDSKWDSVRSFIGYVPPENARNRNFLKYSSNTERYTNNTLRNVIKSVQVTHDQAYVYIKVTTAENLTTRGNNDYNYMNIWLGTGSENNYCNFDFVINRKAGVNGKTSLERSKGGFAWEDVCDVNIEYTSNAMYVAIPLSALGVSADSMSLRVKASDNVLDPNDIMNFYVNGCSAPMGRYAYAYGI